jgi:hypothetical protein
MEWHMFNDSFRKQMSPLQDDDVRRQLQEAILADDAARFREVLEGFSPDLASENRLYSVLTMTEGGMQAIMVDQTGRRLGPDSVIPAGIPIEQLNADIVGDELVVTIGDQQYRAKIGPLADRDEKSS